MSREWSLSILKVENAPPLSRLDNMGFWSWTQVLGIFEMDFEPFEAASDFLQQRFFSIRNLTLFPSNVEDLFIYYLFLTLH